MTDSQKPKPPGGPLREDSKGEGNLTGGHDDDASASRANDEHAEEAGGHKIAIEDEQPDPHPDHEQTDVQEENAESSLDQPSEG